MSKKVLKVSLLVMALGVLVMAGGKSAMAQTATTVTTTIKQPLNFMAQTCDLLEPITFTGTQDTIYDVVNDGTGNLKLNIHSNWLNVSGSTPSGRQYLGTNESTQSIDLDGLPSEQTITISQQWIAKTAGVASMVYNLRYIIKIDVNGNVTSQKDSETVECQQ
jgi:hypothetical protein